MKDEDTLWKYQPDQRICSDVAVNWAAMKAIPSFTMALLKCAAFLIGVTTLLAQNPAANAGDEAAIREIVNKYVDAREHKDPKAVEALFTKDADQLVSSGEWRKGRDAVVRGTLASSQRTGGKRTITLESIRIVSPGVALADGRYELTGLAGGSTRSMWTSLVLTHGADGWRIAAIRNMLPAPPAPSK